MIEERNFAKLSRRLESCVKLKAKNNIQEKWVLVFYLREILIDFVTSCTVLLLILVYFSKCFNDKIIDPSSSDAECCRE